MCSEYRCISASFFGKGPKICMMFYPLLAEFSRFFNVKILLENRWLLLPILLFYNLD